MTLTLTMVKTKCRPYERDAGVSVSYFIVHFIDPSKCPNIFFFLLLVLFAVVVSAGAGATKEVKHVNHIQYRTILTSSNSITIEIN